MTWVDADEVIEFTGLKPSMLKLQSNDDGKLYVIIEAWTKQSEDLIKSYCNNDFKKEVPLAVKNVCLRLTANMVTQAIARRDTPITKVNDWNISTVGSRIFTNDLKEDLEPFKIDISHTSDKIEFFAITGSDIHGESNHKRRRF
ncbi:hypothetical protein [uncultured Methanobrevibacter sp.]|uniref:hypothetical protein n=2 Tax=uncultured Methanobrevibacter sp. TaxID=253161 RepID=UPI0025CCC043|nr:hypothetical protein [uncultured Methanobrevibacter sp.]